MATNSQIFFPKIRQAIARYSLKNFNSIGDRQYYILLISIFILAIISQYSVFQHGFYSVSADESARALLSDNLNFRNALEPFVWPPFYKVFTGLMLKIYDDLFFTPRIIAFFSGLLILAELIFLSKILFGDRTINIITAVLGLYLHHRFIFSIAPVSEMYFNLFIFTGSICLICWLKESKNWQIVATSFSWFLASTTRYEGCYFSLVLLLYLTYKCLFKHEISLRLLAINAFWLCIFPVFWIVNSWIFYGNLENLSITKQQAIWAGLTYFQVFTNNVLTRLILEMLFTPLIFGCASLIYWVWKDKKIRVWTMIMVLALLGIALSTFMSKTAPTAAPWRVPGVWVLMSLPFLAFSLKIFADSLPQTISKPFLLATLFIIVLIFALQSFFITVKRSAMTPGELDAGMYLRSLNLKQTDQKVLIETESYSYLNALVTSNMPERFVLSTGDDPQRIALYVGRKEYIQKYQPQLYQQYLLSKYNFMGNLNRERLAREHIGYVMLESENYQTVANRNPNLKLMKSLDIWNIYKVQ